MFFFHNNELQALTNTVQSAVMAVLRDFAPEFAADTNTAHHVANSSKVPSVMANAACENVAVVQDVVQDVVPASVQEHAADAELVVVTNNDSTQRVPECNASTGVVDVTCCHRGSLVSFGIFSCNLH